MGVVMSKIRKVVQDPKRSVWSVWSVWSVSVGFLTLGEGRGLTYIKYKVHAGSNSKVCERPTIHSTTSVLK